LRSQLPCFIYRCCSSPDEKLFSQVIDFLRLKSLKHDTIMDGLIQASLKVRSKSY